MTLVLWFCDSLIISWYLSSLVNYMFPPTDFLTASIRTSPIPNRNIYYQVSIYNNQSPIHFLLKWVEMPWQATVNNLITNWLQWNFGCSSYSHYSLSLKDLHNWFVYRYIFWYAQLLTCKNISFTILSSIYKLNNNNYLL